MLPFSSVIRKAERHDIPLPFTLLPAIPLFPLLSWPLAHVVVLISPAVERGLTSAGCAGVFPPASRISSRRVSGYLGLCGDWVGIIVSDRFFFFYYSLIVRFDFESRYRYKRDLKMKDFKESWGYWLLTDNLLCQCDTKVFKNSDGFEFAFQISRDITLPVSIICESFWTGENKKVQRQWD